MDDRGRHLNTSTLLLSSTLTPEIAGAVCKDCAGVDGGVEDFLGSIEDVIEVDVLEALRICVSSPM
jgi:hypothetical protein